MVCTLTLYQIYKAALDAYLTVVVKVWRVVFRTEF